MRYIFDLCPKCKDKLIEQTVDDFQEYSETCCPNCGSRMDGVLSGNKKADDTIYKISLNQTRNMHGRGDKCLEIIMRIGNLDESEALEKLNTQDSVIAEGDLLNTYLNLRCLDEIDYMVDYTVTPNFPYARVFEQMCPGCGEKAVYKTEEIDEDEIKEGFFCEKYNDWIMYDIRNKSWHDKTLYHLTASLKGVEDNIKKDILKMIAALCDKEAIEDKIIVHDLTRNIESLLGMMKKPQNVGLVRTGRDSCWQ